MVTDHGACAFIRSPYASHERCSCSPSWQRLLLPASVSAAPTPQRSRPPVTTLGALVQLPGSSGCLVDGSSHGRGCTRVRALTGPAPFLGSEAVAISPDGRNVYVAASGSNAIAVFKRNASTGRLTQGGGTAGCIAFGGASGCAPAIGLMGPNSVTVSADGRNVYSTSLDSDAVDIFRRNPATGALSQVAGGGCIANVPTSGCATGRALDGPDVVTVSPNGLNVYVGSFVGSSIAVFTREPLHRCRWLSRPAAAAASPRFPRRAAPPRSRWALPRAWRSARTATTCMSLPRSATRSIASAVTPPPAL